MSLKSRLVKIEQRLRSGVNLRLLTDEQLNDRLRASLSKDMGVDMSRSTEAELIEASNELFRQFIAHHTGADCYNWPDTRLLTECRRLAEAS
jgi:hypothetical protein